MESSSTGTADNASPSKPVTLQPVLCCVPTSCMGSSSTTRPKMTTTLRWTLSGVTANLPAKSQYRVRRPTQAWHQWALCLALTLKPFPSLCPATAASPKLTSGWAVSACRPILPVWTTSRCKPTVIRCRSTNTLGTMQCLRQNGWTWRSPVPSPSSFHASSGKTRRPCLSSTRPPTVCSKVRSPRWGRRPVRPGQLPSRPPRSKALPRTCRAMVRSGFGWMQTASRTPRVQLLRCSLCNRPKRLNVKKAPQCGAFFYLPDGAWTWHGNGAARHHTWSLYTLTASQHMAATPIAAFAPWNPRSSATTCGLHQ